MEKLKFEGFAMLQNIFKEFGDNYLQSYAQLTIWISFSLILKDKSLRRASIRWQKLQDSWRRFAIELFFWIYQVWECPTAQITFLIKFKLINLQFSNINYANHKIWACSFERFQRNMLFNGTSRICISFKKVRLIAAK